MYTIGEMDLIDNERKIKSKILFENSIDILRNNFNSLKSAYPYTDHGLVSRVIEDLYIAFHYQEKEMHYILPDKKEIKEDIKEIIGILIKKGWSLRKIGFAMSMSHEKVRSFTI